MSLEDREQNMIGRRMATSQHGLGKLLNRQEGFGRLGLSSFRL